MAKISLVYWSGTGNTKAMADFVVEGIQEKGAEVSVFEAGAADADVVAESDVILLGCPSMGDEVLEESEMEPFMEALDGKISGKKIGLFGSYGWGDGQWMRDWQERIEEDKATLLDDGVICAGEPAGGVVDDLKALGRDASNQ